MFVQKPSAYTGGNALLDLLITAASSAIFDDAVLMRYESGSVLRNANHTIEHTYFPIDMVISTTTLMHDGSEVEVDSIGCEGMVGVQLALGLNRVSGNAICHIAGSAVRLKATSFVQCLEQSASAHKLMLRYVQTTINSLEISIACYALHAVKARCARWLLATQDRALRNEFRLTQELLGVMLGVRRETVNAIAQELQDEGTIRYAHGQVRIVDRAQLERISCECYRLRIDRYNELLRRPPFLLEGRSPNGTLRAV